MKQSIIPILFSIIFIGMIPSQAHCNDYAISDEQAHLIVLNGTPEDVKRLIQSGYDVNKVYSCNTLLTSSIKSLISGLQQQMQPSTALEKIKILVENGADVNLVPCAEKNLGMDTLNWAVSLPSLLQNLGNMSVTIFDQRIKMGIGECSLPPIVSKPCKDITEEEKLQINEAIHMSYAEMEKQLHPYFIEIIDYLIKSGANINGNKENRKSIMPIHLAAASNSAILSYLIKNGADINIQDEDGNTPLFWAYGGKNTEAVDMLVEAGANKDIKNKNGSLYYQVKYLPVLGVNIDFFNRPNN